MRNLILSCCYLLPAIALGYYLPQWLPLFDRGVAIAIGLFVLLVGGLLHEVRARLRADALRGEQLLELRRALFQIQEELTWSRREMRILGEAIETVARAGRTGRGGRAIEEVMAEVRVLKSLVEQRPPAAPVVPVRIPAEIPAEPAADRAVEIPPEVPVEAAVEAAVEACVEAPIEMAAELAPRRHAKPAPPPLVLAPLPRDVDEPSVLDSVRAALRDDRIALVLQPIVALPSRKPRHVECFTRVKNTDGTIVLPERYIAVAEREGLITAIDNMLLLRCIQLVRQVQRDGEKAGFFCNISSHTLKDEDFFGDFVDFLDTNHDLAPNLVFEFTQANFDRHGPAESRHLDRLAMLGCRFSIDQVEDLEIDIAALNRRRVAFVKVETGRLLAEAEMDPARPRRLKAALAREGIDLIVEKVEDEDDLLELLDFDVDLGQGFLFGTPKAAHEAA